MIVVELFLTRDDLNQGGAMTRARRSVDPINVRKTPALAVAVAAAVVLLVCASAQAATVSQKAYKIFTTEYKAQLAYSNGKLQASVTAAQTKLAATASSIDALSSSNVNAATALVDELENQYDVAGAIGIFKPALTAFTALSKLPLTHAEHKQAVTGKAYLKRVLAINTAGDLARWQAASFAPAKEPADTRAFGGIIGSSVPSIAISISGSTSAIKAFDKLQTKAFTKRSDVFSTVSNDWSTWAAGFGIASG
jgi:hypothetical protein